MGSEVLDSGTAVRESERGFGSLEGSRDSGVFGSFGDPELDPWESGSGEFE